MSSTLRPKTSQPRSLLSIARLNMARSRVLPSIISRVLIAHICFGRNGGLAPISLPLFQAVRREDSKVRLSLSGRSYSSGSEGDEHSSPRLCQLSEGRHRHLSESLVHVRQLLAPRKWPNAARLCLLLGEMQTEYAFCELGNFYSAGRVDRCCTAAGVIPPIEQPPGEAR